MCFKPGQELSEAEKTALAASFRRHHDEFMQADAEDAAEEQGHSYDEIDAVIRFSILNQLVGDGSRDLDDPFVVEIETDAAEDDGY